MRTFVAVALSPDCRKMLDEIEGKLRVTAADVRWVAVSSIHLTLKFLGEIDPAILPQLTDSLHAACTSEPAFSLCVRGLGAFPNLHNPRVIWCGVEGEVPRLLQLQLKVEQACSQLGFAPEERSFHPHLTLGRVQGKRNLQRLLDCIKIGSELECTIKADHFNVYKSTLTPRGAIYDILDTIPLRT
jgi:2'-5' RNA ligase